MFDRPSSLRLQAPDDARRRLRCLAVATAIGSLGLAAGGTAGPLLAAEIRHSPAAAGIPLGFLIAGSAVSALAIARRAARLGRAAGLSLGYAAGCVGALVVTAAGIAGSLAGVLAGSFLLGGASASVFLSRYAAADLAGPAARGRGLGAVLFAAAVGAVASPNLLGPAGRVASAAGLPELTGLYLVAAPAFAVAASVVRGGSRPGGSLHGPGISGRIATGVLEGLRSARARLALGVLAATNLVMVATMAVAPVHLVDHGHDLNAVGFIVSIHVAGMFGPSIATGRLVDRAGPVFVAACGMALLVAVGLAGAVLDLDGASAMTVYLLLIGVSWNAGMVGASALLAASVPDRIRAGVEGIGEVAMSAAAAVGAPAAGLVVGVGGMPALSVAGAAVAAVAAVGLAAAGGPRGRWTMRVVERRSP